MKKLISLTILSSLFFLIACETQVPDSTYTSQYTAPKLKSVFSAKKGSKCDIVNETEYKEIFIISKTEEKGITISLHEFRNKDTLLTVPSISLGDYSIHYFPLIKEGVTLEGEALILHKDKASLTNEGKVMVVYGRAILDENLNGIIYQKLLIAKDDGITETDYTEIATLENCEPFEANSL